MMPMKKDHLEILLEDIRGKFELVLQGHESLSRKMDGRFDQLNEKIEHNSFLIGTLNKKIDGVDSRLSTKIDSVAADLAAHRADTEAHGPVYRVKESRD
jgi:hypothetical protein